MNRTVSVNCMHCMIHRHVSLKLCSTGAFRDSGAGAGAGAGLGNF